MLLRNVTLLWAILELDKKSYYPLKNAKKVVVAQCFFGIKSLQCRSTEDRFYKGRYSVTSLSIATLQVLLTAFLIDGTITAQKNSFDADTLDGCLHFVCIFNRRVERA